MKPTAKSKLSATEGTFIVVLQKFQLKFATKEIAFEIIRNSRPSSSVASVRGFAGCISAAIVAFDIIFQFVMF